MCSISGLANWLLPFFNSNFITSLVGAGAGACAGAYAAQRIAARANLKNEYVKEIRAATAGFNLSTVICNGCLALKSQHVKALRENYDEKKTEFMKFFELHKAGMLPPDSTFELRADFQTVPPRIAPVAELKNILFDKLPGRRRAMIFSSLLAQSIESLNSSLAERSRLVEEFRNSGPHSQAELFHFYFGLADANGVVDNRYGGIVAAIYHYLDDCIFFSKGIADDLSDYGKTLHASFNKKFKEKLGPVGELKIEKEEYRKLLPDEGEYASWDDLR